jgi:hypothetical protein
MTIKDFGVFSKNLDLDDYFLEKLKKVFELNFKLTRKINGPGHQVKVDIKSKIYYEFLDLIRTEVFYYLNLDEGSLFYQNDWILKFEKENKQTNYHVHTNSYTGLEFYKKPTHSFVFYLSLPENDEGKIWFKKDNIEFSYTPSVGDLLIFSSNLEHMPELNNNSEIPRIVFAGDFCVIDENKSYIKQIKTLI